MKIELQSAALPKTRITRAQESVYRALSLIEAFRRSPWWTNSLLRRGLAALLGLLAYALIVLFSNARELITPRNVLEVLYPALGGAWGFEHAAALVAAGCTYYYIASREPNFLREQTWILRGRQLIPYELAFARSLVGLRPGDLYLWWGMVPVRPGEAIRNFLVVGRPGSGKGVTIELFLRSFVPAMRPGGKMRLLIYDAKSDVELVLRDMAPQCPIQTLNPKMRSCVAWDIARDIRSPSEAREAAQILVPDKPGSTEHFFDEYTRMFFQAVMESFILTLQKNQDAHWTLRDVLLALKTPGRAKAVLLRHPETADVLKNIATQRVLQNVFSSVQIERNRYITIAATWHHIWKDESRRVSLNQWASGESILLLGQATAEGSPVRALNQLVVQRVSEILDQKPNSRTDRTWIILDELTDLQYVRGLDLMLRRGRSKGVACVLGFQTWPGLVAAFGAEKAAEIVGLCGYKTLLATDDPNTAEWEAAQTGNYESVEFHLTHSMNTGDKGSASYGFSEQRQQQTRPSVMPEEFLTLPLANEENGFVGYHVSPQFKQAYKTHTEWAWVMSHLVDIPEANAAQGQWSPEERANFEYLPDWDDEDCKRLCLPPVKEMDAPLPSQDSAKQEQDKKASDSLKNLKRSDLN